MPWRTDSKHVWVVDANISTHTANSEWFSSKYFQVNLVSTLQGFCCSSTYFTKLFEKGLEFQQSQAKNIKCTQSHTNSAILSQLHTRSHIQNAKLRSHKLKLLKWIWGRTMKAVAWFGGCMQTWLAEGVCPNLQNRRRNFLWIFQNVYKNEYESDTIPEQIHDFCFFVGEEVLFTNCVAIKQSNISNCFTFSKLDKRTQIN